MSVLGFVSESSFTSTLALSSTPFEVSTFCPSSLLVEKSTALFIREKRNDFSLGLLMEKQRLSTDDDDDDAKSKE